MKDKVDTQNFRLIELRADNFQRLKAVRIRPDKSVFKIAGRNEQGKSSVLDAFSAAVGGKDAFPAVPIRKGQKEAEIFVDFGGLRLTRRIWNKEGGGGIGHDIVLEYADGKRPREKQAVLDELRGSPIADDPLMFSRMKPKERVDLIRKLVPGVDFDALARQRQNLFTDRTQVGRDFDRAKGAVDSIVLPDNPSTLPVDVSKLAAELRAVGDYNDTINQRQRRRDETREKIESNRDTAERLMSEARKLTAEADELEKKLLTADPLPALKDALSIEQRIMDAEASNAIARKVAERDALALTRDRLSTEYDELTSKIDALDRAKASAIASAKLPSVEGLELGEDDIMLDGLPFEQASTARKLRVSTALLMRLKPDLRVLLVREGSLLDEDSRKALEQDAAENDFVVLMEVVGPGDGSGVVIEDGEVEVVP